MFEFEYIVKDIFIDGYILLQVNQMLEDDMLIGISDLF